MRIEALWQLLSEAPTRPADRRVDESHPLDLYARIEEDGSPALMLLSRDAPPPLPVFQAVELLAFLRPDGRWLLLLRLRRKEFQAVFSRLCQDIIDSGLSQRVDISPAVFLLDRLDRWHRLVDLAPAGLLSDRELRGLLAELLFLEQVAKPRLGLPDGITAWHGPFGAPQDFVMPGLVVEVKAARPGIPRVKISSLDQLDAGDVRLVLAVATIGSAGGTEAGAFTPSGLVARIRELAGATGLARAMFDDRLAISGWTDRPAYDSLHLMLGGFAFYAVAPGFPALRRASVPAGILGATYDIDLSACGAFRIASPGEEQGHGT